MKQFDVITIFPAMMDALLATDITLWSVVAARIDSRLRRSSLETQNDDA